MEDNQNENQEIKPTIEEQLQTSNLEATKLIQDLKATQDEYTKTIDDLISKKNEITNILSEINSAKQIFIDDTNNKLEEYESKFNTISFEISNLKVSTEETFKTLDTQYNELIEKYKADAETKIEEMSTKVDEMSDALDKENTDFDKFLADNKTDYEQQYEKIKNLVSQYQSSTTESLENISIREKSIVTSQSKIEKIEADLQVVKDAVSEYISNMDKKTEEINIKTKKFSEDTQEIITKNTEQTAEIEKQLELATGAGLFHSFNQRKKDLEKSQIYWLIALSISVTIFIVFSIWLVDQLSNLDLKNVNWFFDVILKASASAPVLYLVAFLTDRYTKERRLLEEYAFKSTISLALKPYFDMVSGKNITEKEREFLIKSIENIFTTPTDKVYRTKECQNKIDIAHISEIQNAVKDIDEKIKGDK